MLYREIMTVGCGNHMRYISVAGAWSSFLDTQAGHALSYLQCLKWETGVGLLVTYVCSHCCGERLHDKHGVLRNYMAERRLWISFRHLLSAHVVVKSRSFSWAQGLNVAIPRTMLLQKPNDSYTAHRAVNGHHCRTTRAFQSYFTMCLTFMWRINPTVVRKGVWGSVVVKALRY
jgi:hypothetical protein